MARFRQNETRPPGISKGLILGTLRQQLPCGPIHDSRHGFLLRPEPLGAARTGLYQNMEKGITVSTQKLYWDMGRHEIFSDVFTHLITPDRDIKGNWFRSNESMTEFHIKQTSGYMPMPEDNGGNASEEVTTEEVEEDTTTIVRPREIPIKKKGNPQPVTP